jgi:tryptophan-rich sensory protein
MTPPVLVAGLIAILMLGGGGLSITIGSWYRDLRKPPWNPPNWAFGPAWTVILGLAAWAGVLAWTHSRSPADHERVAILFAINVVFHTLWSPLFFNMRRPDWALIEIPFLWLSILALVIGVQPLSPLASLLLLPYLLWVSFAAFLNLTIVRLNRFGPRAA